MSFPKQLVFDGHNDVLLRLWSHAARGLDPLREFADGTSAGHIDRPRAQRGGLAGGFCAIYIPSGELILKTPDADGHYITPMPGPLDRLRALDIALEIGTIAFQLEQAGLWKICRSTADIRGAMTAGTFAAVLHLEGCEPIGADLSVLKSFHAAGLRSLGPVWSRHNIFGHGVPFAYPMSPDTGPGLTAAGFELVRECNRLGIVVDLAHITEQGFWDVAKTTDQPLVASHSNAHALTPVARNLTDRQLDAVRESAGVVGLNYATTMLRPDGQENADTPIARMVAHIRHMVERMGIDCVALGSDYDGATIPADIGDAAGQQTLIAALAADGFTDDELAKICRENWLRVLRQTWREAA
ncbi:membrane dipeptidase [Angulomicrobium tetraedrale]|uniref:Membrane dipeptidase n=1 Tax=Ancylobacter tetraedralis TaxID=217068 RepID=A0A839ZD34_9HYPH|nr:dipeptidase [Ancylobacter tetraedralis]MBB3772649.1 membrane dipeptidase [Ancylobacter tetraedralis]